jgi:hypothetical protein
MKKIALLVAAPFLILTASAQRSSVNFGIKAGANIANFNDGNGTTGARTGFHGGLLAHIHTSHSSLAVQPELVYSAQGAKFSTGTYKVDYLNIPVLLQYMFSGGFRLETGPQLGVLTNGSFKNYNGATSDISNLKKTDFAWVFGLAFQSASGFGIGARYNLGIADITESSSDVMNRVWQIGAFYQFRR